MSIIGWNVKVYLSCHVNPHLAEGGEVYVFVLELLGQHHSSTTHVNPSLLEVQLLNMSPCSLCTVGAINVGR